MALELLITFNKNDATAVKDFSGNKRHADTVTGLTIGSGEVGKAGDFDGSTTEVDFGNILDLGGSVDALTVFAHIKYDTNTATKYICYKNNHFRLSLTVPDPVDPVVNAQFEVYIGAAWKTVTGATELTAATWYTITGVYDGTDLKVYIDDSEDATTSQAGNVDASSSDFFIGSSDGGDFIDAQIETLAVWSDSISADSVAALDTIPSGSKIEFNQYHNLETGDLIVDNIKETSIKGIVVYKEDFTTAHIWPLNDGRFSFSDSPMQVGHIWDSDRQNLFYIDANDHDPVLKILDGIEQFADLTDTSKEKVKIDKTGTGVDYFDTTNILANQVFS